MSENEQPIEWYLARDGQRHGPVSDLEMQTLVQMGHLRPTDLVWRYGFANWETAETVFPAPVPQPVAPAPSAPALAAAQPQPQQPGQPQPQPQPQQQVQPQPRPQAQGQPQPQPSPVRPAPAGSSPSAQAQPAPQRPAVQHPVAGQPTSSGPVHPTPGQPAPQKPTTQTAAGPQPRPATASPTATQASPGVGMQRAGEAQARTNIDPAHDPMRHRRVASPDAQTRRASGYGELPHSAQGTPPGAGQSPYAQGAPTGPTGPGAPGARHPAEMARPHAGPTPGIATPANPYASGPKAPREFDRREAIPHDLDEDPIIEPRRRGKTWLLVALVAFVSIGLGALYGLYKTGRLSLSALPMISSSTKTDSGSAVAQIKASYKESPLKGYAPVAAEVDANFQKSGLWQIIKQHFPDNYKDLVADTAKLKSEGQDDRSISLQLMKKLVDIRRKNANDALAAKPERLRVVAQTFADNLASLSRISTEACYRFISGGETDPMMVELMRSAEHTGSLQAQFAAIFEAIVDGRVTKGKIAIAERKDYDLLAAQLSVRGWSPADLALFDDARALSRAPPQKVCQMVQDWFAAQIAIKDQAVQTRLFGATLKPLLGE